MLLTPVAVCISFSNCELLFTIFPCPRERGITGLLGGELVGVFGGEFQEKLPVSGEELCITRWFTGGEEEQSTVSWVFDLGLKSLNEWRRLGDAEPGACVGEGEGLWAGLPLPSPLRLFLDSLLFNNELAIGFLNERLFAIPRISVWLHHM